MINSKMRKINIAINGFGRIGRAILRNASKHKHLNIVAINDLNEDVNSLIYLYNYDKLVKIFKKFPEIKIKDNKIKFNGKKLEILNYKNVSDFQKIKNLDFIIDASGVSKTKNEWKKLTKNYKKLKILFTYDHPLSEIVLVLGANENLYKDNYRFISTSICDATALAPFIKLINNNFEVSRGHVTTVHPVLNYQNLLDGRSQSDSYPGTTFKNYSLGRSTIDNIIPKPTTALKITGKSLQKFDISKISGFSYRVPTTLVGSANICLILKQKFTSSQILNLIKKEKKKQKFKIFDINLSPSISSDFYTNEHSLIYDHNWTIKNENILHSVIWYDNENGYSSRVVDQINFIASYKKS